MADSDREYDQDHYKRLMACSHKKDITEWNNFSKKLKSKGQEAYLKKIHLEAAHLDGANLYGAHMEESHIMRSHLKGANLMKAHMKGTYFIETNLDGANLVKAHLEGAHLYGAHLKGANLTGAHLEGADLNGAHLEGANLTEVHLEGAALYGAHLEEADLNGAHLEGANLSRAHLEGANLSRAHLEEADLTGAHLEGASLSRAHLEGACLEDTHMERANLVRAHLEGTNLNNAICDGQTLISECFIGWYKKTGHFIAWYRAKGTKGTKEDKENLTDFRGVGLDNIRFGPGLKQLVEYSNRRLNWEKWYEDHPRLKYLAKFFWLLSDYGRSTQRIVAAFIVLSLSFALLYGVFDQMTTGLHATGDPLITIQGLTLFLRSIYFSVVTMTTLGFGDIHAAPQSIWGHIALTVQVIFGYVILGALVTRLSILFNSDGPSADFSEEEKPGLWNRFKKRFGKTVKGDQESDEDEDGRQQEAPPVETS